MGIWLSYLAAVVVGVAVISYLPTSWWMPAENATMEYLSKAILQKLDGTNTKVKEAQGLSSLKHQLNSYGVKLYAVVHEKTGVSEFREYFKGEIFLDANRVFYGPKERWMFLSGLIRPTVWMSYYQASKKVNGNLDGEGRLLGGLFVIGKGEHGILYEHREAEFGDKANTTKIMEIVKNIDT